MSPCPTCGAVADEFVDLRAYYKCNECGTQLDDADVIEAEELRELIQEWRAYAEQNDDWALEQCWNDAADELEAVLDD